MINQFSSIFLSKDASQKSYKLSFYRAFLSNNSEYDSDEEILDLLRYDLVEMLDEINK